MARPVGTSEDRKVKLLARLNTEKAVNTIIALLDAEEPAVRLAAANAILDRGYGKPKQSIESEITHRVVDEDRINATRQKLRESPSRTIQ